MQTPGDAFEPLPPTEPGRPPSIPDTVTIISPVPDNAPPLPKHYKLGAPSKRWAYRDTDNRLIGYVCRFDIVNGTFRKEIIPQTFCTTTKKPEPHWKWHGHPRPTSLYNAHLLTKSPDKNVLIVEGEKAADAAAATFPDWIVVTSPGGTGQVAYANWNLLAGRTVVIWPDNDAPGFKYAADISSKLHGIAKLTSIVQIPRSLPDKWDLGDPLPADLTIAGVRALVDAALREIEQPLPDDLAAPEESTVGRFYIALGHRDQKHYFLSRAAERILKFSATQLGQKSNIYEICPDVLHWRRVASPNWYIEGQKIDWGDLGGQLLSESYKASHYNPDRVRGRGAWTEDDGTPIVHLGDKVLYKGEILNVAEVDSNYIYEGDLPLLRGTRELPPPLTDREAQRIRGVCSKIRWSSPLYADLFAGWLATGAICGALPWRPHIWVTGLAGTGKSFAMNQIIGPLLGDLAKWPLGASTAPGISRWLRQDAQPVVFDEAESTGSFGRARMEAILELVRQSSTDGRGRIVKAHGDSFVTYNVRSSFCLCSIGVPLEKSADARRFTVLNMRPAPQNTSTQRQQAEAEFAALNKAVFDLPKDVGPRLFSRMCGLIDQVLESRETFATILAQELGGRPIGDQLGGLLAGAWHLQVSHPVPYENALQIVRSRDWSEFTGAGAVNDHEDAQILRELAQTTVTVSLADGNRRADRAIGELCGALVDPDTDRGLATEDIQRALQRLGIRHTDARRRQDAHPDPANPQDGFWLANTSTFIMRSLVAANSPYASGWWRLLSQHPDVRSSKGKVYFCAGVHGAGQWVPAHMLTGGAPASIGMDDPTPSFDL